MFELLTPAGHRLRCGGMLSIPFDVRFTLSEILSHELSLRLLGPSLSADGEVCIGGLLGERRNFGENCFGRDGLNGIFSVLLPAFG